MAKDHPARTLKAQGRHHGFPWAISNLHHQRPLLCLDDKYRISHNNPRRRLGSAQRKLVNLKHCHSDVSSSWSSWQIEGRSESTSKGTQDATPVAIAECAAMRHGRDGMLVATTSHDCRPMHALISSAAKTASSTVALMLYSVHIRWHHTTAR